MIPTKLAILIASFAFSTAVMAATTVPETGMKPGNMDSASCTKTSNLDRNANPQKDTAKVQYALNTKTEPKQNAPVKVKK